MRAGEKHVIWCGTHARRSHETTLYVECGESSSCFVVYSVLVILYSYSMFATFSSLHRYAELLHLKQL